MISEGLWDTEYWMAAENPALPSKKKRKIVILNCIIISHFYFNFDQISEYKLHYRDLAETCMVYIISSSFSFMNHNNKAWLGKGKHLNGVTLLLNVVSAVNYISSNWITVKGVWINFSTNKYVADTLTSSQAEANSSQEVIAMQGLSVPDGELQTYILQLLQTQVGVHKCVVVVWTLRLLQYWSLLLWGRLVLWWQQIPEGQCY